MAGCEERKVGTIVKHATLFSFLVRPCSAAPGFFTLLSCVGKWLPAETDLRNINIDVFAHCIFFVGKERAPWGEARPSPLCVVKQSQ